MTTTNTWIFDTEGEKKFPSNKDLPQPTAYRVLVRPLKPAEKVGSLYIPGAARDKEELISTVGQVVLLGPTAGQKEDLGEWAVKEGVYVSYSKHTGNRFRVDGHLVILMNDDEIQAVVPKPELISSKIV